MTCTRFRIACALGHAVEPRPASGCAASVWIEVEMKDREAVPVPIFGVPHGLILGQLLRFIP